MLLACYCKDWKIILIEIIKFSDHLLDNKLSQKTSITQTIRTNIRIRMRTETEHWDGHQKERLKQQLTLTSSSFYWIVINDYTISLDHCKHRFDWLEICNKISD